GPLPRLRARLADERDDRVGEAPREPRDGPDRACREPTLEQRLGTDEHVEALDEVRLEPLPGTVRDLHPGEVRSALAQALDHREGDRVAASSLELVEVEGRRGAGIGGRLE